MAATSSVDLDRDPRSIVGTRWRGEFPSAAERDRVIREYGADKGLAETLARLADHVAAMG
jgi:hypothetical protein